LPIVNMHAPGVLEMNLTITFLLSKLNLVLGR
jgi:hypothetical protein